jgi:hypothetical protein
MALIAPFTGLLSGGLAPQMLTQEGHAFTLHDWLFSFFSGYLRLRVMRFFL